MGKNIYRLKGHESFVPREGWFTKGLKAVQEDPMLFYSNFSADRLGVGTNMAKSIRYWLRTAGLTQDVQKTGTVLTPLGKIVLDNDPYLEKTFTLWILHTNIAQNFPMATSWNIFFNDFDLNSWKREEMAPVMEEYLIEKTGDTSISERSLKDDCNAILSMYVGSENESEDPEDPKGSPFNALKLLRKNGQYYEKVYKNYDQVGMYPVLYVILDPLNEKGYLNIDDILSAYNMPGKLFLMNRIQINRALDAMEASEYITINRTAGLDMVYPKKQITAVEAVSEFFAQDTSDGEYIL